MDCSICSRLHALQSNITVDLNVRGVKCGFQCADHFIEHSYGLWENPIFVEWLADSIQDFGSKVRQRIDDKK